VASCKHGLGVIHVEAATGIFADIPWEAVEATIGEHDCRQQWDGRGRGWGGGEYDGECLFDNDRDNDKYNDDNKYDNAEDGKGLRRGEDDGWESNYDGCNVICEPSSGGGGRMSILGPHATVVVDDNDNDCLHGRGVLFPPPFWLIPSCRMPLVITNVANGGRKWQHKGVWGMVVRMVEEEEVGAVALVCQVPIYPGVDNGGKRSSVMLVGLHGI
jgi:hypothetical protein